ncbi:MarR family transcriptional regulator [Streptomyces sp. NPDC047130]|uniref:MarR family winged helix-turn-helix transcriptional regulator n=1 Tax=Streptomyces sp. NPDC047130 TaxID=3155261 RepID=UPI0033D0FC49
MGTPETVGDGREDWVDRHLTRRRGRELGVPFDEEVEAITVRVVRIVRHLRRATRLALEEVGLQNCEFETLHELMVRDTPGRATPSALAAGLGVSGAGMTGRLDALERSGWVRRTPAATDRRRVHVEITEAGEHVWRRAVTLRGRAEREVVASLPAAERARLAELLREITLRIDPPGRVHGD